VETLVVVAFIAVIAGLFAVLALWAGAAPTRPTSVEGFRHGLVESSGGTNLTMRRPIKEDVDELIALAREPYSMAANRWDQKTADNHETFLRSGNFDAFASVALTVLDTSGTEPRIVGVGSLGLKPGTEEPSIGIHIAEAAAGQGIGTELMRGMITLTVNSFRGRVWVGTATDNLPMQRIMDKLGYKPLANTEPYTSPNGEEIQSYWWQVGTDLQ